MEDRLVGSTSHIVCTQLEGAAPDQTPSNRSLYGNTHEIMRVMHVIALELAKTECLVFFPCCANRRHQVKQSKQNGMKLRHEEKDKKRGNYVLPSVRKITRTKTIGTKE